MEMVSAHFQTDIGASSGGQTIRMNTERKIALLEGSFDPPHRGYIEKARELLDGGYESVWLLPVKGGTEKREKRLEMCRLLCAGESGIHAFPEGDSSGDRAKRLKKHTGAACCDVLRLPEADEMCTYIRQEIFSFNDPALLPAPLLRYIALRGLYLPDYAGRVKKAVSEKRFRHTLGVRDTAVELAERMGGGVIRCAAAALLHDCAKGMPDAELLRLAEEKHLTEETVSYPVLHGPVGAYIAKKKYGVQDEELLNAVRRHTVGCPGMTLTDLIIFVADAIEPGREAYPMLESIRRAAMTDLKMAAYISIRSSYDYVTGQGKPFDPASIRTMRWLEEELHMTENEKVKG